MRHCSWDPSIQECCSQEWVSPLPELPRPTLLPSVQGRYLAGAGVGVYSLGLSWMRWDGSCSVKGVWVSQLWVPCYAAVAEVGNPDATSGPHGLDPQGFAWHVPPQHGAMQGARPPHPLLALLHLHPRWERGAFSPAALHLRRAGPGGDAAGWHAAVLGALQEAEPSTPGAAPGQQPASPSRGACTTRGVVLPAQLPSCPTADTWTGAAAG